jgi:hypothetical protein
MLCYNTELNGKKSRLKNVMIKRDAYVNYNNLNQTNNFIKIKIKYLDIVFYL